MREFLLSVATVACGICLAAAILAAVAWVLAPARHVEIDLGAYSCVVSGAVVRCERN